MGIHPNVHQKGLEGLPLFSLPENSSESTVTTHTTQQRVQSILSPSEEAGLISCFGCGKKVEFNEYCEDCGTVTNELGEAATLDTTVGDGLEMYNIAKPIGLEVSFMSEGENPGDIQLIGLEKYDFYNVAILKITHRHPGKTYIHKGRRLGSSGKRDGELTRVEKVSAGRKEDKYYRVQYDPKNLGMQSNVFVYSGRKRDGTLKILNKESIVSALKEIEEVIHQ